MALTRDTVCKKTKLNYFNVILSCSSRALCLVDHIFKSQTVNEILLMAAIPQGKQQVKTGPSISCYVVPRDSEGFGRCWYPTCMYFLSGAPDGYSTNFLESSSGTSEHICHNVLQNKVQRSFFDWYSPINIRIIFSLDQHALGLQRRYQLFPAGVLSYHSLTYSPDYGTDQTSPGPDKWPQATAATTTPRQTKMLASVPRTQLWPTLKIHHFNQHSHVS